MDSYHVGQEVSVEKTFQKEEVLAFSEITGDKNPLHIDEAFAEKSRFGGLIVHGIFVAGIFSEIIGMRLPGKGSIYLEQNLRFLKPVYVGKPVVVRVRIAGIDERKRVLTLDTEAYGEEGKKLVCGTAKVLCGKPAF